MMKDDGRLKTSALSAFADIANSLTGGARVIPSESFFSSPLLTGCGMRFAHVDRLCPNREWNRR